MTNLPGDAVRLTDLFARWMAIEELFRTARTAATGWTWVVRSLELRLGWTG